MPMSESVLDGSRRESAPADIHLPHVLCVDDEPLMLEGLLDVLRRRYYVRTATSGAEGLQVLAAHGPFTVIVSDFRMPGMDGAAFLSRARLAWPDTIRILLTGQATMEDAAEAVNEGSIYRLLKKPCAPAQLLKALDDAVDQARLVTADRVLVQQRLDEVVGHLLRAERLATLGTLAAAVGHELNNILTALGGATEFIEDRVAAGLPPEASDLKLLRQAQQHLIVHATNLLHLGRPARDGDSGAIDLGQAVSETVNILRSAGVLKRVDLRLDLAPLPLMVAIKRSEIEQLVVNLVKNAVDALLEHKTSQPTVNILVSPGDDGRSVRCVVADNGPGIPDAALAQLFEPYYTTKPPERGTGLGLFVVRQIADRAGGTVSVASEWGHGASFDLTFPCAYTDAGGLGSA